jgi:hypothetical protein
MITYEALVDITLLYQYIEISELCIEVRTTTKHQKCTATGPVAHLRHHLRIQIGPLGASIQLAKTV